MLNSQRLFVDVVTKYCADRGIAVELKSQGWLMVMRRGESRHLVHGYDIGLNSAVTHRIANDKAATAEILQSCGVRSVAHTLFLNPKLSAYSPAKGSWEGMIALLDRNPNGIVVKPNEGTSGNLVFKVRSKNQLELAATAIFASSLNLAISPFLEIADEVRVVLIDDVPMIVYSKRRPSVVGDGVRTLIELILAETPADRLAAILPGMVGDLDRTALQAVLPAGQRYPLNWRHNLETGAEPVLLEQGTVRDACVALATEAARAIKLRFGSVDLVDVDGVWQVLEVNSGVVMEALGQRHPDLVHATYGAALDKVFAEAN